MSKSLPANIILEKNKLASPYAWLTLLDITLTDGTAYRLVRNDEDVLFSSVNYALAECDALWTLDDDAATTNVIDSTGDYDGTLVGGDNTEDISVAGKVDEAFNLNGIDDGITTPYTGLTTPTSVTDWSIDGLFYCEGEKAGSSDSRGCVFAIMDTPVTRRGVELRRVSNNLQLGVGDGASGESFTIIEDITTTNKQTWYHVVVTFDNTTSELRTYLNNVLIDTRITDFDFSTSTMSLGRNPNAGSPHLSNWYGKLDTWRAWSKKLSVSEIDFLYNNGDGTALVPIEYTGFPFQLGITEQVSKGQIPTVDLRVSNITRLLEAKLQELNGAIGSTVKITVINSNFLSEDYTEMEQTFDVLTCSTDNNWVIFTVGAPSPLRQMFPIDKYQALHCRWQFESVECSYDRKTIIGVTLSDPVSLEITDHEFEADDEITLYTVNGITGGIEGNYKVKTDTDSDNFTIKTLAGVDVDGADFAGAYTSGGFVGYTKCERTLTECSKRENKIRFGGMPGMRSGSVRLV